MAFDRLSARLRLLSLAALGAMLGMSIVGVGAAKAQITPQTVQLINRLCAQSLRTNEEDRLYGMISLAVRATIRYRGAEFRPDVIDDAVQDALDAMIEDCPELTSEDESKRLTMAIEMISEATTKVLEDFKAAQKLPENESPYPRTLPDRLTAADLSGELSSQEIDQWLNSMPPRQRALSLFLYASDVTPKEIAEAVGESPALLARHFASSKSDLMHILREEWSGAPAPAVSAPAPAPGNGPAMAFSFSGKGLATLMKADAPPAPSAAAPNPGPAAAPGGASPDAPTAAQAADPPGNDPPAAPARAPAPAPNAGPAASGSSLLPSLQVTGISDDLYAGWSLLATGRNLPRGERITINGPFILEPNREGIKRMLVVDIAEIGDPNAATRRFLLKAYAIDGDKEAGGVHEGFHVGAPLDNPEAKKTLANASLSSIEVARCLWHDFGTGDDPGLCR